MQAYKLFPSIPVRSRRCAQAVFCFCATLIVLGFVGTANGQSNSARPVARLVSASERPVQISSARAARRVMSPPLNSAPAVETVRPSELSRIERRAFALINDVRRANGEGPLVWDAELSRMAREHSEQMARRNFLAHTGPDGRDTVERAHADGITGWRALAENIAYNQGYDDPAAFAVERWTQSVKHRENILRAGFTHSAIGVAKTADGRIYFTQVFVTR